MSTALYQNGVVGGEKSGSKRYFKPNDSITRAELERHRVAGDGL